MDQRDSTNTDPNTQPAGPRRKKSSRVVVWLFLIAAAVVVVLAVRGNPTTTAPDSDTGATDTTTAAPVDTTDTSDAVPAAPTTTEPTVAAQVTFSCTGSAPDGLSITYGPNGSSYSASSLPFTKTMPLDSSAQYYVTTAQLSGSGSVTCTTVIQASDGSQWTNSGTAQGGYNIASAEICGTYSGGWQKC